MYKTTGLAHLINSTKYSLQGLKSAFKNETAFRHECFLACILIPLAFFLGETKIEIILMISSVLLVMALELLNSAVEAVVDRISTERHCCYCLGGNPLFLTYGIFFKVQYILGAAYRNISRF